MQHIPMSRGRRGRRGFTMVELLIALVLLGLVSAALYRVLVNNQRLYMAQTQRIDLSQNIRAALRRSSSCAGSQSSVHTTGTR